MNRLMLALTACACLVSMGDDGKTIATENQKISYIIGMNMAQRVKRDGIENLDLGALKLGMEDVLAGRESQISNQEAQEVMQRFRARLTEEKSGKMERNVVAGAEYRQQYARKAGVKSTRSGVLYRVLREGKGPKPNPGDHLVAHYRGTLIDGTEFDSSVKSNHGKPVTFSLRQMIPGWQEVLPLMPVGSKWELVVPQEMAYGSRSFEPLIEPGSTLVFEVELLGVQPGPDPTEGPRGGKR